MLRKEANEHDKELFRIADASKRILTKSHHQPGLLHWATQLLTQGFLENSFLGSKRQLPLPLPMFVTLHPSYSMETEVEIDPDYQERSSDFIGLLNYTHGILYRVYIPLPVKDIILLCGTHFTVQKIRDHHHHRYFFVNLS